MIAAINGPAACSVRAASPSQEGVGSAGSGAAPIEGLWSPERIRYWLDYLGGCRIAGETTLPDAEVIALLEAAAELAEMKRDRAARNKIDPTTRLHNLCDALAESRRDSPFTQEAWDAQDEAYREKCDELARVKGERDADAKDAARWRLFVQMPVGDAIIAMERSRDRLGTGDQALVAVIDAALTPTAKEQT